MLVVRLERHARHALEGKELAHDGGLMRAHFGARETQEPPARAAVLVRAAVFGMRLHELVRPHLDRRQAFASVVEGIVPGVQFDAVFLGGLARKRERVAILGRAHEGLGAFAVRMVQDVETADVRETGLALFFRHGHHVAVQRHEAGAVLRPGRWFHECVDLLHAAVHEQFLVWRVKRAQGEGVRHEHVDAVRARREHAHIERLVGREAHFAPLHVEGPHLVASREHRAARRVDRREERAGRQRIRTDHAPEQELVPPLRRNPLPYSPECLAGRQVPHAHLRRERAAEAPLVGGGADRLHGVNCVIERGRVVGDLGETTPSDALHAMRLAIREEAVDPVGAAVGLHDRKVVEEVDVDLQLRLCLARDHPARKNTCDKNHNDTFHDLTTDSQISNWLTD